MPHCYSPYPAASYRLPLDKDEITVISQIAQRDAIWNLFWMTTPTIDTVIGAGENWWRRYRPNPDAMRSVINDVCNDEVLYRKLLMNPNMFIEWFERADHTLFDCYDCLGGEKWVDTVLSRANEAAGRLLAASPLMVVRDGKLQFTRATP